MNYFGLKKFESVDASISQEQDAICSNGLLTALAYKATATVAVFPAYGFKRFDNNIFLIKGHQGNVTDCDFSPFNDTLLATASEDTLVKLWTVPQDGLTEHLKEAAATL